MKPLMILFLPWAYFFTAGRPVAGAVHFVVWLISIPLFFVFGLGIIIWLVQVTMAGWDLRKQLMEEQATAIATKMAETMRQAS
jgi:hypothetical protein